MPYDDTTSTPKNTSYISLLFISSSIILFALLPHKAIYLDSLLLLGVILLPVAL